MIEQHVDGGALDSEAPGLAGIDQQAAALQEGLAQPSVELCFSMYPCLGRVAEHGFDFFAIAPGEECGREQDGPVGQEPRAGS